MTDFLNSYLLMLVTSPKRKVVRYLWFSKLCNTSQQCLPFLIRLEIKGGMIQLIVASFIIKYKL